jgi:hypothetical protein
MSTRCGIVFFLPPPVLFPFPLRPLPLFSGFFCRLGAVSVLCKTANAAHTNAMATTTIRGTWLSRGTVSVLVLLKVGRRRRTDLRATQTATASGKKNKCRRSAAIRARSWYLFELEVFYISHAGPCLTEFERQKKVCHTFRDGGGGCGGRPRQRLDATSCAPSEGTPWPARFKLPLAEVAKSWRVCPGQSATNSSRAASMRTRITPIAQSGFFYQVLMNLSKLYLAERGALTDCRCAESGWIGCGGHR